MKMFIKAQSTKRLLAVQSVSPVKDPALTHRMFKASLEEIRKC